MRVLLLLAVLSSGCASQTYYLKDHNNHEITCDDSKGEEELDRCIERARNIGFKVYQFSITEGLTDN